MRGWTMNSYSSIRPASARASGSLPPPTEMPLPGCCLSRLTVSTRSRPRMRSAFQSTLSSVSETTEIVRLDGRELPRRRREAARRPAVHPRLEARLPQDSACRRHRRDRLARVLPRENRDHLLRSPVRVRLAQLHCGERQLGRCHHRRAAGPTRLVDEPGEAALLVTVVHATFKMIGARLLHSDNVHHWLDMSNPPPDTERLKLGELNGMSGCGFWSLTMRKDTTTDPITYDLRAHLHGVHTATVDDEIGLRLRQTPIAHHLRLLSS